MEFVDERGERYLYCGHEPLDCPGGTLMYRRQYWRDNPFQASQCGEERAFLALDEARRAKWKGNGKGRDWKRRT